MTYQDFEAHIDYGILQRGQQYFALEAIKNLKKEGNTWSATVAGTEQYSISIRGASDIEKWSCTCPFDHGPVCKHVVAVLYTIQNRKFEEMLRKKN